MNLEKTATKTAYVLDIGSASIRLICGKYPLDCDPDIIFNRGYVTRLREALSQSDGLDSSLAEVTLSSVKKLLKAARLCLPDRGACLCTQAVRQAHNNQKFLAKLESITGLKPDILTPEQEGNMAWMGSAELMSPETLLIDLGGGSTEFVWMEPKGDLRVVSIPIASATGEVKRIGEVHELWLKALSGHFIPKYEKAVLLGGTASTFAGMYLKMEKYSAPQLHGLSLPVSFFLSQSRQLAAMPKRLRTRIPGMEKGRETIAVTGGFHLAAISKILNITNTRISERGIRFGKLRELTT